jgi:SAM-dependent methyltransferase
MMKQTPGNQTPINQTPINQTPINQTPINQTACVDNLATVARMRTLYDHYFSSTAYRQRYPFPNAATLQYVLANGAMQAKTILDVGCGDGRYAIALLNVIDAHITGCDISSGALQEFQKRLDIHPFAERVSLVHGGLDVLPKASEFDMALVLFGVLSHAGDQDARVKMLKDILKVTAPNGCLLLSVPNIFRRRPFELLKYLPKRLLRRSEKLGDIEFTRRIAGKPCSFVYHLFSVKELKRELALAGWRCTAIAAESLLPEYYVTQYPWVGKIDALIQPLLPAWLGYGIRLTAHRDLQSETRK